MKTETYVVDNSKLQSDQTLAVISDLHLKEDVDLYYYACMLGAVDGIKPDYIALVGDYFNGAFGKHSFENPESREHLKLYLHSLREIAPVVMSLGNDDVQRIHDKEKRKEYFKSLEERDIYPLDNESVVLGDFNFMGYMPPKKNYPVGHISRYKENRIIEDMDTVNFDIKKDKMNVLLSHLPNIIMDEYIAQRMPELYKYDLILSGHFHGGLNELQEQKLNRMIDKLQYKKSLKFCKDFLEKLRYAGFIHSHINPIPKVSVTTRGMHMVNGTPLIISRGANKTEGLDDTYVTKVRCIQK